MWLSLLIPPRPKRWFLRSYHRPAATADSILAVASVARPFVASSSPKPPLQFLLQRSILKLRVRRPGSGLGETMASASCSYPTINCHVFGSKVLCSFGIRRPLFFFLPIFKAGMWSSRLCMKGQIWNFGVTVAKKGLFLIFCRYIKGSSFLAGGERENIRSFCPSPSSLLAAHR